MPDIFGTVIRVAAAPIRLFGRSRRFRWGIAAVVVVAGSFYGALWLLDRVMTPTTPPTLVNLPPLPALLVNPGVALATRDVFAAFAGSEGSKTQVSIPPREREAAIDFLARYGNDLTQTAVRCAPVITEVLMTLRALPGVRLARMSGSGPTCFALFRSPGEASEEARRLQAERKDWWVQATLIG